MTLKILIVDDEVEIQNTLRRFLEYSGIAEVLIAGDVESALEQWRKESPAIIVSDLDLPGQSGLDLLREIKKHTPAIQVILITGKTTLDRALDGLELGAIDYLMKPLDMDLMERVIHESIDRYKRWHDIIKINLHKNREKSS